MPAACQPQRKSTGGLGLPKTVGVPNSFFNAVLSAVLSLQEGAQYHAQVTIFRHADAAPASSDLVIGVWVGSKGAWAQTNIRVRKLALKLRSGYPYVFVETVENRPRDNSARSFDSKTL